jgi:hypothetical protein
MTKTGNQTPLDTRDHFNGTWTLLADFVWYSEKYGLITVPTGFPTDFASTPQFVWSIMPKNGDHYDGVAVVHDWIYNQHLLPQAACDELFLEGMLACGVSWIRAHTMYRALRMFGSFAYDHEKPWPGAPPPNANA